MFYIVQNHKIIKWEGMDLADLVYFLIYLSISSIIFFNCDSQPQLKGIQIYLYF
jgi:hypothetical protein